MFNSWGLQGNPGRLVTLTAVLTSLQKEWAVWAGQRPGREETKLSFIFSGLLISYTLWHPSKNLGAPQEALAEITALK